MPPPAATATRRPPTTTSRSAPGSATSWASRPSPRDASGYRAEDDEVVLFVGFEHQVGGVHEGEDKLPRRRAVGRARERLAGAASRPQALHPHLVEQLVRRIQRAVR